MFSKEAALLKRIDESRQAIRKKQLNFKHGLEDVQDKVSKIFNPIVQPLKKIAAKEIIPKFEKKVLKKVYHSTPWKGPRRTNLFSSKKNEKDEKTDGFMDFKEDHLLPIQPQILITIWMKWKKMLKQKM